MQFRIYLPFVALATGQRRFALVAADDGQPIDDSNNRLPPRVVALDAVAFLFLSLSFSLSCCFPHVPLDFTFEVAPYYQYNKSSPTTITSYVQTFQRELHNFTFYHFSRDAYE